MSHSVSASGIVVNDDGEVLVIRRRDNGHGEPPGGVLEPAEAAVDGARREILEETGMAVEVERLTGVYQNIRRDVVAMVFRCRPLGPPSTATDEAAEVRWMTLDEVQAAMVPAFAVRVTDAFGTEVRLRVHDGMNCLSFST